MNTQVTTNADGVQYTTERTAASVYFVEGCDIYLHDETSAAQVAANYDYATTAAAIADGLLTQI